MEPNVNSWREEIIWAAGLFEGEGSFVFTSVPGKKYGQRWTRSQVSLHTTDKDVLERFVRAVGFGTINGPYTYVTKKVPIRKPSWYWSVGGHEKVQAIVGLFWPWLGVRRKAKAKEVLLRERTDRPNSLKRKDSLGRYY
jgi:hypothetical protein